MNGNKEETTVPPPAYGFAVVRLANGAASVRALEVGETFHPVIGPVAEAEALYLGQLKLRERIESHAATEEFILWDVGLGAAANPLVVLRSLRDLPRQVRIVSFDASTEPLSFAIEHAKELEYPAGYERALKELVNDKSAAFTEDALSVHWELHLGDFPTLLGSSAPASWPRPHAILFDAFSPARNPAMWTGSLFRALFASLDPRRACSMATYSRSTMLRVTLLLAGFFVGVGHATGEKEETTLAANTLGLISEPLGLSWLERVKKSTSAEPLWEPKYRQAPLSPASWERLRIHPQFQGTESISL